MRHASLHKSCEVERLCTSLVVVKQNLSRCSQQDVSDTKNTGEPVPEDCGRGPVYEARQEQGHLGIYHA